MILMNEIYDRISFNLKFDFFVNRFQKFVHSFISLIMQKFYRLKINYLQDEKH